MDLQRDREARLDTQAARVSRVERRGTRPSRDGTGQEPLTRGRRRLSRRIDGFAEITPGDEDDG